MVGDGWLTSQTTPNEISAGIRFISSIAKSHNRNIDPNHIGTTMGFYISKRPLRDLPTQWSTSNERTDISPMEYTAIGTVDQIATKIKVFIKAGASKFVVRPLGRSEENLDQLSLFGQEIIPIFHK
jgi:alkanesulfonate monooxygenase SsuD/methylene tetrahydromethanopterin reductase-like flavin-dependent oxidoreductase (luciferase family)